ncbi:hypothetical protein [Streptomyces sp. NPDC048252]|uniref:hypothetical protein n=1 Tax=Streptomyces sp. NPDC048252 TaxID=3154612 RepID=UPI00343ED6A4
MEQKLLRHPIGRGETPLEERCLVDVIVLWAGERESVGVESEGGIAVLRPVVLKGRFGDGCRTVGHVGSSVGRLALFATV